MKIFSSLRTTLIWSMILIAIFSVGVVGTFWIMQEHGQYTAELLMQKEHYLDDRRAFMKQKIDHVMNVIDYKRATTELQLKESIKNRVFEAIAIADNIYNSYRGQMSDEEIQNIIKEALRSLRFNSGRGYFFIYDMKGNNILLPFSPHLEGKNLWNLQDSNGQYNIQRAIKLIQEKGSGFQRWYWHKSGETKLISEKIGFFQKFTPYDWWIGTGEYVEDFEKDIQRETLDWIETIRFGKDGYVYVYDFKAVTLSHF